ncbi:MAG: DUF983 domain-containing protein [Planctomycetota bacterium]
MTNTSDLSVANWKTYLLRTLRGRCPRCGEGALFVRRFRLHVSCPECGLVYRREQGGMTGQMYLSAVVTQLFSVALILTIFFGTDWSTSTSILVGIVALLAFSYLVLPFTTGAWIAIEFLTDIGNREPWLFESEENAS